jgi:hypothetical protein
MIRCSALTIDGAKIFLSFQSGALLEAAFVSHKRRAPLDLEGIERLEVMTSDQSYRTGIVLETEFLNGAFVRRFRFIGHRNFAFRCRIVAHGAQRMTLRPERVREPNEARSLIGFDSKMRLTSD